MGPFLEKYTEKSVPDESTVRKKYVKTIFDATLIKIKEIVGQSPFCMV